LPVIVTRKPAHPWYQFSLRSLLLLIVFVAALSRRHAKFLQGLGFSRLGFL